MLVVSAVFEIGTTYILSERKLVIGRGSLDGILLLLHEVHFAGGY